MSKYRYAAAKPREVEHRGGAALDLDEPTIGQDALRDLMTSRKPTR